MDKTLLVERDIEPGRRLIEALDQAALPLPAAVWIFVTEESEWRLVLASPEVKERGPRAVYQIVQETITTSGANLSLNRVSVVEPEDGLITEFRIFMGTDGAPFIGGTFLHGMMVGDAFIDAAYVYRAERIVGTSGTMARIAATPDRTRKVWVARPAKVLIEEGLFKKIETEGFEWPQTQARNGINAHLDLLINVKQQGNVTVGDIERWTITSGRLRHIDNVARGVTVEGNVL